MNQLGNSGEIRKKMKYASKFSLRFPICLLNQLTRCKHTPASAPLFIQDIIANNLRLIPPQGKGVHNIRYLIEQALDDISHEEPGY